jgi:hypothetical protein
MLSLLTFANASLSLLLILCIIRKNNKIETPEIIEILTQAECKTSVADFLSLFKQRFHYKDTDKAYSLQGTYLFDKTSPLLGGDDVLHSTQGLPAVSFRGK